MPELKVVFKAVTSEFDRAIKQVNDKISETNKKFAQMTQVADKLSSLGRQLTMSLTVPITALATAAGMTLKKFADFSDRISDLTAITGMSARSIQEWQHVARMAGVDVEAVTNAIAGLIRKIPSLEAETGISADQLAKLGINLEDIKNSTPDEAVDKLINALVDMDNVVERNAVASAIFGLSWKDIAPILDLGKKRIEEAKNEAHKLGLVISDELIDKGSELKAQLETLKAQLEVTFIKVGSSLVPVLKTVGNIINSLTPIIESLAQTFAKLPAPLQEAVVYSMIFLAVLGPIISAISSLIKMIVSLKTAFTVFITVSKSLLSLLGGLLEALQVLSFAAKVLSGILGFLIVDFITGAIQAEKLNKKISELQQTMNHAASDAERYAAAMQLFRDTKSIEAFNKANAILEKYGITITDIMDKAEELNVSYDEAAVYLIRQAEATKQAKDETNRLNRELSTLVKVQNKNLQAFDEVHTISKDQESMSPFSNLVDDIKALGSAIKTVNFNVLKDSIKDVFDVSYDLDTQFGDLSKTIESFNPVISTSLGNFQMLDDQLQYVGVSVDNLGFEFQELQVSFSEAADTGTNFSLNLSTDIQPTIVDTASTIDSLLLPTVEDISTTFDNVSQEVYSSLLQLQQDNADATDQIVTDWQETSDELVGHSIVPDMADAIKQVFANLSTNLNTTSQTISNSVVGAFDKINQQLTDKALPDLKTQLQQFEDALKAVGLTANDVYKAVDRAFDSMARQVATHLANLISGNETLGEALKGIWKSIGDMFRNIFISVMSQIISQNLTNLASWVAGVIAQAAAAVGAFLTQAYAALVAFYAWLGPGAPIAAAATMAGVGAAIVAFGAWAVGAIKNALGLAEGGIVTQPTFAMVGEAGPEAVIPLNGTLAEEVEVGVFNALSEFRSIYSNGQMEQNITIELDGVRLAQTLVPYILNEFNRLGIEVG